MRRKFLIIVLFLTVFTGFTAGSGHLNGSMYSHNIDLHLGEEQKLHDYIFGYSNGDSGTYFEVLHDAGDSKMILEQVKRTDLYEAEGYTFEVSNGLKVKLNRIAADDSGQYLNMTVYSAEDIFSEVKLTSSAPARVIASRGETVTVPLDVKNNGLVNRSFGLRADTNSSLTTTFSYDDFNVTRVFIEADDTEDVDAKVKVPEEARLGAHKLTFYAGNGTDASESIQIEVKGAEKKRVMDVDVEQIYKEVRPGKTTEFYVQIRNRGEAPLEDINLTATPPKGWDYNIDEGFIERLRNRYGRERAKVAVTAPPDASAGDYMMEISAESKRTGLEEPKEVRIHVRKKSGLSYIGAALMGLSLLILVIVYRKFQRR